MIEQETIGKELRAAASGTAMDPASGTVVLHA